MSIGKKSAIIPFLYMSVEQFFYEYPANNTFAQEISFPPTGERKSPVRFMAEKLTNQGREGLVKVGPDFLDAVSAENQRLIQRYIGSYLKNSSAIYLGASIMAIEDILKDGHFDSHEFNSRLRYFYSATFLDPVLAPNEGMELIEEDKMKDIIKVATKDKTFTTFFYENFTALPAGFRHYLDQRDNYVGSPIISNINNNVIKDYEKRVSLLINPKKAA